MRSVPDNITWFQTFLAGDERASDHYFKQYNKSVFYIAYKVVKDTMVAEDIVVDAFMRTWENRDIFSSEEHILAYWKRVAKNLSLNHQKHIDVEKAWAEESRHLNKGIDEADAERDMIEHELMASLHRAVQDLPKKCQEVMVLLAFQGLTTKEAAERLGISERNVLNQKAIAVKRLKGLFSG